VLGGPVQEPHRARQHRLRPRMRRRWPPGAV
jgi:hypothetical protein